MSVPVAVAGANTIDRSSCDRVSSLHIYIIAAWDAGYWICLVKLTLKLTFSLIDTKFLRGYAETR